MRVMLKSPTKMVDDAWKKYADPSYSPPEGDVPWAVLEFSNLLMPSVRMVTASTDPGCTMDTTLAAEAQQSIRRFLALEPTAQQAAAAMAALRTRYHAQTDDQLQPDKMSSEDQNAETVAKVSMAPVLREEGLLLSIENARQWWATCVLVYQSRQADVRTYGPSWPAIGNTIQAEASHLSPETKALIGIWQRVDVRYPSEVRKEILETAALAQKNR